MKYETSQNRDTQTCGYHRVMKKLTRNLTLGLKAKAKSKYKMTTNFDTIKTTRCKAVSCDSPILFVFSCRDLASGTNCENVPILFYCISKFNFSTPKYYKIQVTHTASTASPSKFQVSVQVYLPQANPFRQVCFLGT